MPDAGEMPTRGRTVARERLQRPRNGRGLHLFVRWVSTPPTTPGKHTQTEPDRATVTKGRITLEEVSCEVGAPASRKPAGADNRHSVKGRATYETGWRRSGRPEVRCEAKPGVQTAVAPLTPA
ncbi:hypothetical protein ACFFX0_29365 [Citricoccus parietis]|uniref:Uncharacterized protein n=1 Tax=Citricoccus parietis TaxID=592307 RepID=A0ABV5G7Y9_9MICC